MARPGDEDEVGTIRPHRELLESILTHAPDFVAHITADGHFLFLNRFVPGLGPEDLRKRTIYDFTDAAYHDVIRAAIARVVETRTLQDYETLGKGPTDGPAHYFTRVAPVIEHGAVTSVVLISTDVSRLKQLEAQLAQSQKLDSIGQLAGGIAHDFNNMLTAILSYTQLATAALPPGSPIATDLAQVKLAAERSVALTSQLLAFARQQVIEPRVVSLNDVVVEVDKLLRRVLGEDIEVVTVLEATGRVRIDPSQFEQVLVNLATNARDAMPAGGRLTIRTADLDPDFVVLAVTDTGVGIAAADQVRIFEPFFTTKDRGKGTGLGLAMCYGAVAQHRGHIAVTSAPGCGTTFEIRLPVAAQASAAAARLAPAPGAELRGTETILVAEDEPQVRAIVVRTLTRAGYRVLDAADGAAALEAAGAHVGPIHLLVTDVVMPKLGGKQLAQQLAVTHPETAVLFMSGYVDDAVVRGGVLVEGVDFLQKPFTPTVLAERVRQALARAAPARAAR